LKFTVASAAAVASSLLALASCLVALPASSQTPMQQTQAGCQQATGLTVECVRASATDPKILRFDGPNYVFVNPEAKPNGQILLFLPGTGGDPPGPRSLFLAAAASAGYRVISLAYNDDISVAVFCPKSPIPLCSGKFRAMRLYGNAKLGETAIDNTPEESIINRLARLLQYFDRLHPDAGWGGFLKNGEPDWERIAVSGQSQGAGMAAFLAKQHVVARVILFSSPWDYIERNGKNELAPWIATPSKTPPERWFGGYHARENAAGLLARSYAALRIPPDHIRVYTEDLPPNLQSVPKSENPFHGQGLTNRVYAEQRDFFLRAPEQ
jgi:hypothetical protein